jgi:thiamine biosynthesis lipoprotein
MYKGNDIAPRSSASFVSMTTECSVLVYDTDILQSIIENVFDLVRQNTLRLEKKYSFYNQDSYLNKVINNRETKEVLLDDETANVLSIVKEISSLTNGYFDITMGTLKHCYKETTKKAMQKSLDELSPQIGFDSWDIKDNRLYFKYPKTKLDLGGVIKEYAIDEAVKIIKSYNIKSAIVNFGGDISTIGSKPDGNPFGVAIKNPINKEQDVVLINLFNKALTTSANTERWFEIEGERFPHIQSKNSTTSEVISATIIADSALVSGIFSTAFMIGTDIDIPDFIKVALIDKDLRLHQNIFVQ